MHYKVIIKITLFLLISSSFMASISHGEEPEFYPEIGKSISVTGEIGQVKMTGFAGNPWQELIITTAEGERYVLIGSKVETLWNLKEKTLITVRGDLKPKMYVQGKYLKVIEVQFIDIINDSKKAKKPELPTASNDQPMKESWNKTFGGSDDDDALSIQETVDGGFIITGWTNSFGEGGSDIWLIRTQADGTEIWNHSYGRSGDEAGFSVRQTKDLGFIIAGWTKSLGLGGNDLYLVKTDPEGREEWNRTFGKSGNDEGRSVQQTRDGGYLIAGRTESYGNGSNDIWLIKTDQNGEELWNKTFGGPGDDDANSIQKTMDGGFMVVGWINSSGYNGQDVWLLKTYSNGTEEWSQTLGRSYNDLGLFVLETTDKGYVVAGATSGPGITDIWLLKTFPLYLKEKDWTYSLKEWSNTFGGPGADIGTSLQETKDGGYVIAGWTTSYGSGLSDIWLLKTDSSGNKQWDMPFGGNGMDTGEAILKTRDGSYLILGTTTSFGSGLEDAWLVKVK